MQRKRLVRNMDDKMCCGVASGIADYINIDPVIVRLVFVLLTIATHGFGLLVYILLAILMPAEPAPVAKVNSFDEEEIVVKES